MNGMKESKGGVKMGEGKGFKVTIGILVGILFLWNLIVTLQVSSVNSAINNNYNSMANSYASKYDMTSLTSRITNVETKLTYETPTKWTVDNQGDTIESLQSQINNAVARIGKCSCSW